MPPQDVTPQDAALRDVGRSDVGQPDLNPSDLNPSEANPPDLNLPQGAQAQGARVVAIAREWLGTPYLHQASLKGAGSDCLGLIRGIWRGLYGQEPEMPPAYSFDWGESGGRELLREAAARWLVERPIAAMALGDVLLFRMREEAPAKHLGIISALGEQPSFIHAYSGYGVVESSLSRPWLRRIAALYHFPQE